MNAVMSLVAGQPQTGHAVQEISFGATGNSLSCTVYGWSSPEDGYRWTIGKRSVLCLDKPDAPHGYRLEITWSAYLPRADMAGQAVEISVGGRLAAQHMVGALESIAVNCPPPEAHEDRLLIAFDHPDAARPSAVSGHQDDRMLALCFRKLRLVRLDEAAQNLTLVTAGSPDAAPAGAVVARTPQEIQQFLHAWPLPALGSALVPGGSDSLDIVFGAGGNSSTYLADGWSGLESGYVWAIGQAARLALPPLQRADAYQLTVLAQPFVSGVALPRQTLQIFVNGTKLAEELLSTQVILQAEVPWPVLSAAAPIELLFKYPDAARPADLSDSGDDRMLGFQFKRLMLNPVRAAGAAEQAPAPDPAAAIPLDELMKGFESLGENCEFGLVQRRCGAEPLGLLRFASAPLDKLMPALRHRFAGMGAPQKVKAELSENGREYMVLDKAYGFYYHAWVNAGEKTPAEIEAREIKRVPFLVRKLTEDFRAGEKLFLYHGMRPVSLVDAQALAAALRAYGPTTLLWVEVADADHPAGSVEWIDDSLMKAYIERFAPGENAHDLALHSWIMLCRRAWNLKQEPAVPGRKRVEN